MGEQNEVEQTGKGSNSNPRNGPSTSADVALRAGVSRAQVSYVLNGTGGNHVSDERRERILAAARELDYRPHQFAQALRRGYANEFCLFFPAPYPPRISAMLGAIHESGLANGCMPVQYSFHSYRDPARKTDVFKAMLARKPLGLFCSLLDVSMEDVLAARATGVRKLLVLDVEPHEEFPTLRLDFEAVGFEATRHLLGLGHGKLAILRPSDPIQTRGFEFRLAGMQRALAPHPEARLEIIPWHPDNMRPTLAYALEFADRLLALPDRPTAIYAHGDDYALPLVTALTDRGIAIPDDISVLGTDDNPYGALTRPALTSIKIDSTDLGSRALRMIDGLIRDDPDIHALGVLPGSPCLVIRSTTAAPRS